MALEVKRNWLGPGGNLRTVGNIDINERSL